MSKDLVDILIPDEQKEGTELEMGTWLKKIGEPVDKDEPVAELVTDKAVVEIPSPASGVLKEILVESASSLDFEAVLGRIAVGEAPTRDLGSGPSTAGAEELAPPPTRRAGSVRTDRPVPHPAVLRLAARLDVDVDGLNGSGRDGRVTAGDVRRARGRAPGPPLHQPPAPPRPEGPPIEGPSRRVKHGPMRKSIARNMAASLQTAPHVTAVFSCDMSAVIAHRAANKARFADEGANLTFSAYFLQATLAGIREVPEINSRWHDDALEIFEHVHVGVGTALEDKGLVVPVLKNVQDLDLLGTAKALTALTEKARSGKLGTEEMKGSTFTISNHGVMGSLIASPIIINQPESAILGIGKLEKRPVAGEGDAVEVRPMMYVTLTIDHRVLDAFHTNRFLTRFVATLEDWK